MGGPGTSKKRFSLESGSNFHIFSYLKIRCLLDPQKPRFWEGFGSQVGCQNRPCGRQEGAERPNKDTKKEAEKRHRKTYQKRSQHKPVLAKEREARCYYNCFRTFWTKKYLLGKHDLNKTSNKSQRVMWCSAALRARPPPRKLCISLCVYAFLCVVFLGVSVRFLCYSFWFATPNYF